MAELIAFIEINDNPGKALPVYGHLEDFYARCVRMGRNGDWMRKHWPLLEQAFRDHLDDKLTDEHLAHCFVLIDRGWPAPSQPRESRIRNDEQRLTMWAENDRLGLDLMANQSDYFCGQILAGVFSRFMPKRYADYPELAERYYGAQMAAE